MSLVQSQSEFITWRKKARELLQKGVQPQSRNSSSAPTLFTEETLIEKPLVFPKASPEFLELAQKVACARSTDRWDLLYRIIYRLNHENPHLLKVVVDEDVRKAQVLAKSVSRDIHKMHAFVRFKRTEIEGQETYVAWHKPEHFIIEQGAPFFVRRFGDKPWSIFTPDGSAHWNLEKLELQELAKVCKACPLAITATQTVFGDGPIDAQIMIVGEQPGDEEDLQGKPFLGPAGKILDQALAQAGIPRKSIYITNAVKHFKWSRSANLSSTTRTHQRASGSEMHACKPWLEAEISRIKPKIILALGVSAGTALYGRLVKIKNERGQIFHESSYAPNLLISWHPSAILRASSEEEKIQRTHELTQDLLLVAHQLKLNNA